MYPKDITVSSTPDDYFLHKLENWVDYQYISIPGFVFFVKNHSKAIPVKAICEPPLSN